MNENAANTESSGTMWVLSPRLMRRSDTHQNGAELV
jgi:hypothetical protein